MLSHNKFFRFFFFCRHAITATELTPEQNLSFTTICLGIKKLQRESENKENNGFVVSNSLTTLF